ncbi:MAG: glycosyltransferase family 2 protein [Verrucomicrobiales bacterium]|nr:glycosyltransferase family 2 protein [Verrucomicrobiota bacterium JB025]
MFVSIIIPTYNRAATVLGAVESALRQSHDRIEVIVVDDGSTDGTEAALAGVRDRIKYVRQENAGPSAARNRGAREAGGEILAFLDSDDHWTPDKIERQVKLMARSGPGMSCCVCNATVKGEDGVEIGNTFAMSGIRPDFTEGEWTNPQDVLATRFLLFNQVVAVRRSAFEEVGGFNDALRLLEDYELSIRLGATGVWGVIRDPLVIKFNDTVGIGVECMNDHVRHAEVKASVISGLLEGGHRLGADARSFLEKARDEARVELKAARLMAGGIGARGLAKGMLAGLRVHRAVRRRSPGWPAFEGRAI